MNDKVAVKQAEQIRRKFWDDYNRALGPDRCSLQTAIEEWREVLDDAEIRIEAMKEDLASQERADG